MKRVEAASIGDIIKKMLKEEHLDSPFNEQLVILSWPKVVGNTAASYTGNLYISNGTLYAQITSAALRQELFMMRSEIIRKLNESVDNNVVKNLILK